METKSEKYVATAKALAVFTIVYSLIEGAVAMSFGAHDSVLSLFGFGLDSLLESATGAVVLWRLAGLDEEREKKAEKIIGGLLIALAIGLALGAGLELRRGPSPTRGLSSIVIAIASLAVTGWLYRAKIKVARALNSKALLLDAFCTKSCMWLSVVLLVGAAAFEVFGWALFDPIVSTGMAWLIFREGKEAWDNEDHCGCADDEECKIESGPEASKTAEMQTCTLMVEGMVCGNCEWAVDSALRKDEGFLELSINYKTGRANVKFDPSKTDPNRLATAIVKNAGYTARFQPEPGSPDGE